MSPTEIRFPAPRFLEQLAVWLEQAQRVSVRYNSDNDGYAACQTSKLVPLAQSPESVTSLHTRPTQKFIATVKSVPQL